MRHLIASFVCAGLLAGCSNPWDHVPRIGDANVANGGAAVAEVPNESLQTGGLFDRLTDRQPDDQTNAAVEAALRDVGVVLETSEPISEAQVVPAAAANVATPRRGLAGIFRRNSEGDEAPRTGPDRTDVEPGAALAFGQIARVCGVPQSELGQLASNEAGFRVYDSDPSATEPRAFYITGFNDDCARTFTGAVVVPGDVQTHEFVRYQSSNERIDYSSTDNAYEAIKASICRVGRGQPCGARTDRLNQNTHFVTVYGFFGGTFDAVPTKWAQILLHDGEVLAMSIKDG